MRALLLGGAAVVLLMLVSIAAGGYRIGSSDGGLGSGNSSPYAIDTLVTVAFAVYAIGAVAVIIGMFVAGLEVRRQGTTVKRTRTVPLVTIFLGVALLLVVASGRIHFKLPFSGGQSSEAPLSQGRLHDGSNGTKKVHEPQLQLLPFLLVIGGAGAGLTALLLAEKRRRRRLPSQIGVADELSDALEVTLDDLRAERDPRRAVIAAYVRMERALAAHGIPRRRFEAPHEYLARVLDDLTHGGRGARQLTELFEQARFSTHDIAPSLKDEAIAAVESLQAELAAAQLERAA
jgi:hypothetical protein